MEVSHRRRVNWDTLEQGIFENIVARLPVKNILVCKSVSKRWCGLLSTPHFVSVQLSLSKENVKYIMFPHMEDCFHDIVKEVYLMEVDRSISETYILDDFKEVCTPTMISSFNGLICCTNDMGYYKTYETEIRICNPATREVFLLPEGGLSTKPPVIGLAYSTEGNEYKIFKFFRHKREVGKGRNRCEIYSSRTATWRRIRKVRPFPTVNRYCRLTPNQICVKGKLYFLINSKNGFGVVTPVSILSVDMEENFKTIALPHVEETPWRFLIELDEKLSLVVVDEDKCMLYVWVYDEQWSLRSRAAFEIQMNIARFDTVAGRGNDILIIIKDTDLLRHFLIYNVDLATWTDFETIEDREEESPVVLPFTESLLRPRGF